MLGALLRLSRSVSRSLLKLVRTSDTYNYWGGDHYHDEAGPMGVRVGGRDVDADHPAEPEAPTLVDPARDKLEAQGNLFFYVHAQEYIYIYIYI